MKQNSTHDMQRYIAKILSREAIMQQQVLLERLQQEGVCVAQATLSRCLRRMGVAKIGGVYRLAQQQQGELEAVLRIQQVPPNLLVLHTLPGHASSVAACLDGCRQTAVSQNVVFGHIAATLAGDDTVLVVVKPQQLLHVQQLLVQLCSRATFIAE
ncbi:MAG: ArgR family transcriptional regulator [Myxococcota bacterium]